MYISEFQILNYKSFLDSGKIELKPGINIITGKNNAGKSALLKAMFLNFKNEPHRSVQTLPNRVISVTNTISSTEVGFNIDNKEFFLYIKNNGNQFEFPFLDGNSTIEINRINNELLDNIRLNCRLDGENQLKEIIINNSIGDINYFWQCKLSEKNKFEILTKAKGIKQKQLNLAKLLQSRIYYFQAERLKIGEHSFGNRDVLLSDASNLPEVLNCMHSNPDLFNRFNDYVRIIFPQIFRVEVRPKPDSGNFAQIVIWNIATELEREDLVVPLSESGTGISQVLAILYVVLSSKISHTIIIDEPQSFLHPGAAKKMIEILKEFSQHQYIIATHSPLIIATSNPSTINIIKYIDAKSMVESIDLAQKDQLFELLNELGVSLSDVFGADGILWVEGETEEICFPLIIEHSKKLSLHGNNVLSVKNTGDFEGKHSIKVFEIYDKLTKGAGFIPPAVGFIFDKENKTQKDIDDFKRKSKNENNVYFLGRKMFENYLLVPEAIFYVLNSYEFLQEENISLRKIKIWITKNKFDRKYINQKTKLDSEWIENIDGAKFLIDLFNYFSKTKLSYNKTTHSILLCKWLLENQPQRLDEIVNILKEALQNSK